MFNYIITIHNSEQHLRNVLEGVKDVKGKLSEVYCVLDGCTDLSESIVDEYGFHKIFTPDVRETEAINIALSQIPQVGYNIILQDDVVLLDKKMETRIIRANTIMKNIGVLGFRHGSNFKPGVVTSGNHVDETDLIQSEFQQFMVEPVLNEGYMTERQVVYKSPICISSESYKKLGGYDKRFYPIAHDDTEYCIRAYKAGFKNFVCALEVYQPVGWGGTRRFPDVHSDNFKMHMDHMNLIRKLYPKELEYLSNNHPSLDKIQVWKT